MNVCGLLFVFLWGWEPGSWVSPQPFSPAPLLPYPEASLQALGIFSADNQSPGQVSALGELTEQRGYDKERAACSLQRRESAFNSAKQQSGESQIRLIT